MRLRCGGSDCRIAGGFNRNGEKLFAQRRRVIRRGNFPRHV
jgi:hypothetical protein